MPGPITINFINFSSVSYQQSSSYTGYTAQHGVSSMSQQPANTLDAFGGATTISMDENALSNLTSGLCSISCGWMDPSGLHWGVKICMPAQIAHMGSRPYYQVAYGQGGGPEWQTPVSDPSKPYDFPSSLGVEIVCTPNSQHTSLVVQVSVSDPD